MRCICPKCNLIHRWGVRPVMEPQVINHVVALFWVSQLLTNKFYQRFSLSTLCFFVVVFWNLNSARPKAAAKIHAPEKVLSQEDRLPHLIFRKHLQSPNQVKFYVLSHMKLQFLEPWSIYGIPGVSFNLHCVHLKTC